MKLRSRFTVKLTLASLLIAAAGVARNFAGSVAAPYQVATWSGFRPAAISYTFDDSCPNQFAIALPMFNQSGLKMTLFSVTSGGLFAGWPRLQNAASFGHEIGSHTVSHSDLSLLSDAQQLAELTNSQNAINANVTTQKCLTLAYPYCNAAKESLTTQFYLAARNCSGVVNSSTPPDFLQVSCFICGASGSIQTLPNFTAVANNAVSMNGWCVYLIHGIDADGGYSPLPSSVLQASVNYFTANTNLYWVQTFGNVYRYIRERNDVSAAETSSNSDSITLQVTGTLDSSIYNYPLTMRRPLPAGWPWAAVSQNSQALPTQIVTNGSQAYVMFDAVPNGGDVKVARIVAPNSQFRVTLPAQATEGDGVLAGQGGIVVTVAPSNDVPVSLTSSYTNRLTVPAIVTLPAGQTNIAFDITIVDNTIIDLDQVVIVTATAPGYGLAKNSMLTHDNDTSVLTVTLPATASEGAGVLANAGHVSVPSPVGADVVVQLASSGSPKLIVPSTATIPNGQSSAAFDLSFVDNNIIDGPQTSSVTAHFPNWVDGSASIVILDDELPPDHFTFSTIPSPQLIGEPFQVTIMTKNAANNTLDFILAVTLDALLPSAAPAATNTFLGSPTPEQSLFDGAEYSLGYSFTPATNLWVTAVRSYFGDKVSVWTDTGNLLVSQPVTNTSGTWMDTPLPAPLLLLSGVTYRLTVHENAVDYFWNTDSSTNFPDGTINQSWWDFGDVFPSQTDDAQWYFVDLRYSKDIGSVAVSPGQTGNFTNGVWSGAVTVLQPGKGLLLRAIEGNAGVSNPFDVAATPKLTITPAANAVILSWPAAAQGFTLQQTPTFSTALAWTNVPCNPAVIDNRYTVTNPQPTTSFYRLSKP